MFAQSVGGGGGIAGQASSSSGSLVGSAGGTGNGAAVSVFYSGNLSTSGTYAHGIVAQSVGGNGNGSTVNVTVGASSSVTAGGSGAYAILAQSDGQQGKGNVTVDIGQNATVTGGHGVAAVLVRGGTSNNQITNYGSVSSIDGVVSGTAIQSSGGNALTTINNSGTVSGQISNDAANFNNMTGGVFNSGTEISVGSTGTLSNAGTLSPGGSGRLLTTTLSSGSLAQSSSGTLAIDVNPSRSQADKVIVAGAAQLAGTVQVNLQGTKPTSGSATIVSASGGVSSSTQSSLAVAGGTAVVGYGLTYPSANDVVLNYSINYANPNVLGAANGNQQAMAQSIQQVAGGNALDPSLSGLINLPSVGSYLAALDSLSPQVFSDHQVVAVFSGMGFSDALLSCAARDGAYRFIRQDECAWVRFDGWGMQRRGTAASRGLGFSSFQFAGGGQFDVGDDWLVGAGGSVEFQNSLGTDAGLEPRHLRPTGRGRQAHLR